MGGFRSGALEVMAEQVTGRGARAVVAAAAPMAAALGAEAIRMGGNAYDAAVTALLAETVLLPPKCGLGGDLVALRLRAGADAPDALIAIGPAAEGLPSAVERDGHLPEVGPLSVGPPAAPAGYAALAEQGRLPLAQLVAPAVALARDGFAWSSICTWLAGESSDLLREHQPDGCRYLPDGRPPQPGQIMELPGLALALEELGERGRDVLAGPLGEAIVRRVREAGGVLTVDDLASANAEWVAAARVAVGDWDVWTTPAPTHGAALLDALAEAGGRTDAGSLWRAFAAATGRRRASLGDPRGGTSMVAAAEAGGDVVVVIHSNSFPQFGSGLVVPEYDLILNNRAGRGFTAVPGHPNAPVAGRRPATTLHAWAAGRAGRPEVLGGTPGGANQVSWNLQLVSDLVAGHDDPGMLVARSRWEWNPDDDSVVVEDGMAPDQVRALEEIVPGGVTSTPRWGLRCAQQVIGVPPQGGSLWAAADPRTGSAVVGV